MSIAQDIAKARKKPLTEEKMRELMLKLRKGASGTLTFAKLVQVFDVLGWEIHPITGWTPIHYEYNGKEVLVDAMPHNYMYSEKNEKELRQIYADVKSQEIDQLPDSPSHIGEIAIADVSNIQEGGVDSYKEGARYPSHFYYRKWIGTEGYEVTTTSGASEGFLPDRHDLSRSKTTDPRPEDLVNDTWIWAKENGLPEDISAYLGTEVHVPAEQRTQENTGTCPACWGNFKMEDSKRLVLHGFRRLGQGISLQGQCFGVGFLPAELSVNGLVAYRDEKLAEDLSDAEGDLDEAQSGQIVSIKVGRGVVDKGHPQFNSLLRQNIDNLNSEILSIKRTMKVYQDLIDVWKPRPLPQPGQMQRSMRFFLK